MTKKQYEQINKIYKTKKLDFLEMAKQIFDLPNSITNIIEEKVNPYNYAELSLPINSLTIKFRKAFKDLMRNDIAAVEIPPEVDVAYAMGRMISIIKDVCGEYPDTACYLTSNHIEPFRKKEEIIMSGCGDVDEVIKILNRNGLRTRMEKGFLYVSE